MTDKKELLIIAGLVAAQRWQIDPQRVDVIITKSPLTLRTTNAIDKLNLIVGQPAPRVNDEIQFEQWLHLGGKTFWIGYSRITNTLAVCIVPEQQEINEDEPVTCSELKV